MKNFLRRWFLTTIAILIIAYLLRGIQVEGVKPAVWAALLLGFINVTIKPMIRLFTFPLTLLTLGLFAWVINALLLLLVSLFISGFQVIGFWNALLGALLISVVSTILNWILVAKPG
jgi:putative membrane protein